MSGPKLRRCSRCGKRCRSFSAAEAWNIVVKLGVITELICPGCQTPMENLEAAVNEATIDYSMVDGLLVGRPKTGGAP